MEKYTDHWITDEIHIFINGLEQHGLLFFENGTNVKQYSIRIEKDFVTEGNTQITIVQDITSGRMKDWIICIPHRYTSQFSSPVRESPLRSAARDF